MVNYLLAIKYLNNSHVKYKNCIFAFKKNCKYEVYNKYDIFKRVLQFISL